MLTFWDLDIIEEQLGGGRSSHLNILAGPSRSFSVEGRLTYTELVEVFPDFKAFRFTLDQECSQTLRWRAVRSRPGVYQESR